MFIPATKEEAAKLGWQKFDVILVTGDTYIDSIYNGAAVIGKLLIRDGYRVGIIAQPDVSSDKDIRRLGEPELFWGISAGCVDSMVANYTATKKKRRQDDFTPGGINNRRPDRASMVYTNLIRKNFKGTVPIVLGGIEASLRRVVHYDFWQNKLRRSILFDSKADYLIYGMGEKTVLELAKKLKQKKSPENIRGLSYISHEPKYEYIQIPSYEECNNSKDKFSEMFEYFYQNNDPLSAKGLYQKTGERYLIQNPPQFNPSVEEIDLFHDLDFERDVHPLNAKDGKVRALDTIKFSILTHRGCYGECNFCAIAVHQGRTIVSRTKDSILKEVKEFTKDKKFKGIISDVGGPTANMYDYECKKKIKVGMCNHMRCVHPETCKGLKPTHKPSLDVLREIRRLPGVRKAFVASGIRYDLVAGDKQFGYEYLKEIAVHHTSGQLKIAPEHTNDRVLDLMGKPGMIALEDFKSMFYKHSQEAGKRQFLTYYLIAAHPGCGEKEMKELKTFASEKLKINPEQVQIFTPTPSTYSTLMYYTEKNPWTGEKIFVEKDPQRKQRQKDIVVEK
ncbi:MAG: YgiQ family radical SAM protein, partial [Bacteroidota bacterium]